MSAVVARTEGRTAVREVSGVHLVGSVPLRDAETVFRRVAGALGDRLRRMPDGETGERSVWIAWQYPVFRRSELFEPGDGDGFAPLRLRPGAPVADLEFGELGYARAAIDSWATFSRLKAEGVIPAGCRFLVSLPTPLGPVLAFVAPEDQQAVEQAYEDHMLAELHRILDAIPPGELALQWDARYEFSVLEGALSASIGGDERRGILERLVRLSHSVPDDVELGYHLCYGDEEHGHFVEPTDAHHLVDVADALAEGLRRPLDWIHMPVPRDRADDAYFAPLRDLLLPQETELYLGLIGPEIDLAGTRERIAAAQRHLPTFGVATECGWGRGDERTVEVLLDLHRAVCRPVVAAVQR
jgi:hypothetical protein